jgi:amino acid transporter
MPAQHIYFFVTYASLAFYLLCTVVGFCAPRFRRDGLLILPLWLGVQLLFHLSLGGKPAVTAFARLAILAWPAALLIAALALERRIPKWLAGAVILALAIHGVDLHERRILSAVSKQNKSQPVFETVIRRLDRDEPLWIQVQKPRRGKRPANPNLR